MSSRPDVQEIQRTARQETYNDGLLELVIGGLMFIVALATGRPPFYWTYLVAILLLGRGLRHLKARYTYPRIGYVKFPDEDASQLGRGMATWVIGVFLLVALALTLSGHLTDNLAWRRAAPGLGGLLFGGGFLFLARQSRLARHYVLTAVSMVSGVLMVWPTVEGAYGNFRVWAMLMALVNLSMGAEVFRRFLRDHPVVQDRMPDGN